MDAAKKLYRSYLQFSYDYPNIHSAVVMVFVYIGFFIGLTVWSFYI